MKNILIILFFCSCSVKNYYYISYPTKEIIKEKEVLKDNCFPLYGYPDKHQFQQKIPIVPFNNSKYQTLEWLEYNFGFPCDKHIKCDTIHSIRRIY